jgi:hypothetical protein
MKVSRSILDSTYTNLLLLLPFVLRPLACFLSELMWNYRSYRRLVGLLGRVISPSRGRYLHRTTQTQKKRGQTSIPREGFEPTVPVFERTKTCNALDRAATVTGAYRSKLPNYEAPHYVIFSSLFLVFLTPKYSHQPPSLKYLESNNYNNTLIMLISLQIDA